MRVGVPTAPREVHSMKSLTCLRMSAPYQVKSLHWTWFQKGMCNQIVLLIDADDALWIICLTWLIPQNADYFPAWHQQILCVLFSVWAWVALLLNQQGQEDAHWLHKKWLPLRDRKVCLTHTHTSIITKKLFNTSSNKRIRVINTHSVVMNNAVKALSKMVSCLIYIFNMVLLPIHVLAHIYII